MSWVIWALTLGASITSMIHGVFMLFETLANNNVLFEISNKTLACMTVASGVFALIGGIIAFNRSKWGALFLFIAAGLCLPSKDMWIYSGIYLFSMLLCFFLKPAKHDEYEFDDLLYDEENEEIEERSNRATLPYYFGNESENYAAEEESVDYQQGGFPEIPKPELKDPILDDVAPTPVANIANIANNEPPKLRRRMLKTCPTCGATVARDSRFCSTCGAALIVPAESLLENQEADNSDNSKEIKDTAEQVKVNLNANANANANSELTELNFAANEINFNANDGDDMAQASKVLVKPKRDPGSRERTGNNIDAAASSYQEFSRYTKRAKKRKRSAGRKILSIILLIGAVGGALYFLLGLRKLPDAELPSIARNALLDAEKNGNNSNKTPSIPENIPATGSNSQNDSIAVQQNTDIAVPGKTKANIAENILPNFTPEREPKSGVIIGSNVNVRSDHSTSSNKVARLNVNSKVEIIGNYNVTSGQYQGIWYNVVTGGKEGWIYGRYVQPTGSGLPAGYSNALLKTFGSNKAQLAETLGQPSKNSSTSAEWQGLTATFKGDEITKIRITNSKHELQNGLKIGMSQTALLQIMGFPSGVSNKILQYNEGGKTGVSVQIDKNNTVSAITVNKI